MATRMLQRRGTAAEWAALNPVLGDGEIGFERDTKIIRVGDGITPWNNLTLPYLSSGGGVMTGPLSLVAPTEPNHGVRLVDLNDAFLRAQHDFVSSGAFYKGNYPKAKLFRVTLIGGGASGGGTGATGSGETSVGGGGGAGGYSERIYTPSQLSAEVSVTIGAGGTAVTASNGNNGGTSSFATVSASGGIGGGYQPPTTTEGYVSPDVGAIGGNGSGGRLNVRGGQGDYGVAVGGTGSSRIVGGKGGDSRFGAGGRGGQNGPGFAGTNYGGGGGGASRNQNHAVTLSGAGAPGIVIVEVFG
jgi:hypothetical protein